MRPSQRSEESLAPVGGQRFPLIPNNYEGNGGESGIRTHVRVSPKHAFQACAFSHSAISPATRIRARSVLEKFSRMRIQAENPADPLPRFYGVGG
jgi:hypothetical protein